MRFLLRMLIAIGLLIVTPFAIADEVKTVRVKFDSGKSSTAIKGSVKGYNTVQYLVGASAGQTMSVGLSTKNTSTYFNIFAPGDVPGNTEAMFIGDLNDNRFKGTLPETGDYLIQVFLVRSAARRNEASRFTVNIAISGATSSNAVDTNDAKVEGTDFNATGEVPCARNAGQPLGSCKFGVVRKGNGNGEMTVFWPDGGNRIIYFKSGKPTSFDESEADGGAKLKVKQNADLFIVTIGDQRFEIPDAVITGG